MSKTQRMLWIDMEMTGLNPEKHVILEIATIVTDENPKILEAIPINIKVATKIKNKAAIYPEIL